MRKWIKPAGLAICCLLALSGVAGAQQANADAAALAQTIQNPVAALVTVPFQFNYNSGVGEYDRLFLNVNVQPVIPFEGENWNVIARTILPVNSAPVGETDSIFGIGDATLTLLWTPAQAGKVIWGIGPIIGLPTASNPEVLGSGKWGLGPSALVLVQPGSWTLGALASNTWSIAGDEDRDDYNRFFAQYFITYGFGGGWAIGSAPIITADWNADSGNQWTIPWGLNVSKVTRFGSVPVNLLLGYYENSEYPEGAAEGQVRFQINFMFPTAKK